jgi:hypothetical protein
MDQTVGDPTGVSLLSRVVTPMVLLAPLIIGLLLFGVVYGRQSSQVASDIDAQASLVIVDSPDGAKLVTDRLCPDARSELAILTFHRLDPDDPSRKSSISGLGFDRGVIDLKGWQEAPTAEDEAVQTDGNEPNPADRGKSAREGGTTAAASDPAAQDSRDDISLRLRRSNESWCVADVVVR